MRSRRRNFEVFSAEDFIAAITQHIPDKGFQMVRYYGWYSNRARGERAKKQAEAAEPENPAGIQVIDVSDYQPRRLPSKKWRELIKQVWEVDPFDCPRCGAEMKMIALIDEITGEVCPEKTFETGISKQVRILPYSRLEVGTFLLAIPPLRA